MPNGFWRTRNLPGRRRGDALMNRYFQKILGFLAIVALCIFAAVQLIVQSIGLANLAEDALAVPRVVRWVVETPWWVPTIIFPLLLVGFAAWVFRPDKTLEDKIESALAELRASNERAWQFEPTFLSQADAVNAKIESNETAFNEFVASLNAMRTRFNDLEIQFQNHNARFSSEMPDLVGESIQRYMSDWGAGQTQMLSSVALAEIRQLRSEMAQLGVQMQVLRATK